MARNRNRANLGRVLIRRGERNVDGCGGGVATGGGGSNSPGGVSDNWLGLNASGRAVESLGVSA